MRREGTLVMPFGISPPACLHAGEQSDDCRAGTDDVPGLHSAMVAKNVGLRVSTTGRGIYAGLCLASQCHPVLPCGAPIGYMNARSSFWLVQDGTGPQFAYGVVCLGKHGQMHGMASSSHALCGDLVQ